MTAESLNMAVWFRQWEVSRVVMESTGDYWKGVYYLLEAEGFECLLVDADVKNTPGRAKTDKLDAVWLAKVAEWTCAADRWCTHPKIGGCGIDRLPARSGR